MPPKSVDSADWLAIKVGSFAPHERDSAEFKLYEMALKAALAQKNDEAEAVSKRNAKAAQKSRRSTYSDTDRETILTLVEGVRRRRPNLSVANLISLALDEYDGPAPDQRTIRRWMQKV